MVFALKGRITFSLISSSFTKPVYEPRYASEEENGEDLGHILVSILFSVLCQKVSTPHPVVPLVAAGCGSVHAAAGCSGASAVLKPLKNSQKGRRMIWNAAMGRTRTSHPEPPGEMLTRSNQPAMLLRNIKA